MMLIGNRKLFEKILLGLIAIVALASFVAKVANAQIAPYFAIALLTLILTLALFYFFTTRFSIYSLILLLYSVGIVGIIFKIQHYPGADLLLLSFLLYPFLFAVVLIKTGVELSKNQSDKVYFNYLIAAILLIQIVLALLSLSNPHHVFHYGLLGVILTMKIQRAVLKKEESQVLNLVALQSMLVIINDTVALWA